MEIQWAQPEMSEPAPKRLRTVPRNNKDQQDAHPMQAKVHQKNYPGLSKFQEGPEVDKFKAARKMLVRLSKFVKPPPLTVGSEASASRAQATAALRSIAAENAACSIEEEIEELLEETLAKFDQISDRFVGEVEGLRELVLAGDEWYKGGLMLSLEQDELKKALAQATTITGAADFRLHVEQAMDSMPPKHRHPSGPDRSVIAMELKCKSLTCMAYLGRFGPEGTRQAFHLLGFISTHEWSHEPGPTARRLKPGSRPMGVIWKVFAGLIGSGPDKQVEFQGNYEAQWFEMVVGTAMPDWQSPAYWDFCAAYRTMTSLRRIREDCFREHSFRCACDVPDCASEMRRDWLRQQAVDEVKGKLTLLAPPDLPVELMDIILDFALRDEGLVDG